MDNRYCCRGTFSGFFPGGLTILLARTSLSDSDGLTESGTNGTGTENGNL